MHNKMCPAMQYCDVITNPIWRTAAILKIAKSPYLSEKSSDFYKILYTTADIEPNNSHVTTNKIFKIQDGGGRHRLVTDCPISAKFCMRKQNGMSTRARWQKLQIYKIQDGGRPPFWKSLNRHISVKNRPILMKFGTLHHILNPVKSRDQKLKFLEFKMAAAAILNINSIQRQITWLLLRRVWYIQWFRFQWPWVTLNLDFKVAV